MRPKYFLAILALTLPALIQAEAPAACATTIPELRNMLGDQALPLHWQESPNENAKPFLMDVQENNDGLRLTISRSSEGLWIESSGAICRTGNSATNRFTLEQVQPGPAANWLLRQFISQRETVTLTRIGNQLLIATAAWDGRFTSIERMQ